MAGEVGILGALRILVDADASKAERVLKSFGGKAQLAGAAIGGALGTAAIAGLKIGDAYDAALDGIRSATGATGDELAQLEKDMNSVAAHTTEDLGTVASVLSALNQKTGQTGEIAQQTTESLVDLARLTGGDYVKTAEAAAGAYVNWNIAAQDQVAANDMLLRAYQATGVSVEAISDSMTKNGAVLRELGLSWADSIGLVAGLEKAGIDAAAVMGPLRKSLANLVKAGKDPRDALAGIFEAIKNAPSEVKAGQIALENFGSKGVAVAGMIRDGTLDLEQMYATIADGGDTVQAASDDTRDWADGIKELVNQVTSAVGPVTSAFAGMSDALGNFIFLLPAIGGFAGKQIGKGIAKAAPLVQKGLTAMLAKIGLEGAATSLASRFASLFAAALPIVGVAALGVAIGAAIGKAIVGPEVEKAMKDEAGKASAALAGATTIAELDRQRAVLEKGLADAEGLPFSNFLFGTSDQLRQQIADIDAKKQELIDAATKTTSSLASTAGASLTASSAPAEAGEAVGKSMAKGIKRGFRAATAAAGRGFGSVRDALQNPPKIRSKAWRLDHLQKQMRQVMANLRKAVKANDPVGVRYWETARAKVANSQRWLGKQTKTSMSAIRKEYKRTGVNVDGTWKAIKDNTKTKATAAENAAVDSAQDTKNRINAVDLRSSGIGMMSELAGGIYAGIPEVRAASTAAAAAAAAPLEGHSPPKVGPLSTIDEWGARWMDSLAGGIYGSVGKVAKAGAAVAGAFNPNPGGMAFAGAGGGRGGGTTIINVGTLVADERGLDELERRMGGRKRLKKRQRRDPYSPNGMDR